jgi:hypothetical protein
MGDHPPSRLATDVPREVVDGRLMDLDTANRLELLCHIRKTPNVLYGMFSEIIKQFYSNEDNLPIELPSDSIWDPDPAKTQIWIDTELKWDPESIEHRPAIYVELSQITYKPTAGGHDGAIGMDLEQGEYHFSRTGNGTVSFNHVGNTKGESAALAGATADFLDGFGKVIKDSLNFEIFEIVGLSPISLDKESRDRYRSIVAVNYVFQDTWSLKLESPKLKRLIFRAGQNLLGDDTV